jgi:drug/metabolite transporter (DMT)-like permease
MSWPDLYSLACGFSWALGVVLLRRSGGRVAPLGLNAFKNILATILFAITIPALGLSLAPAEASASDWALLLLSGALGLGLGDTLFLTGLNQVGASRAAIGECLYAPLVAICASFHPELAGPNSPALIWGFLLVGGGLWLSAREVPGPAEDGDERRRSWWGLAYIIASVLIMAIAVVIAKPVLNRHEVLWCTLTRLYSGTAVVFLIGWLRGQGGPIREALRPSALWWQLAPTAFVSTYIAMMLLFAGLKYGEVTRASLLNQTSTFFVAPLAWLILGETMSWRRGAAMALGFAGAAVVIMSAN